VLERGRGECLRGAAAERGEGSVRPQIGSASGVGSQARVGTRRLLSLSSARDGPRTLSVHALLDGGFHRSPTLLAIYSSSSLCAPRRSCGPWARVTRARLRLRCRRGVGKRPRPSGVWSMWREGRACVLSGNSVTESSMRTMHGPILPFHLLFSSFSILKGSC
jgi:hypothetical protein